jgi:uncharacterized protein YbbC (DUF1343 family)
MALLFGVDHAATDRAALVQGKRIALLTNDAATSAAFPFPCVASRVALAGAGARLVRLFSPEHGLGAAAADGRKVGDQVDPLTGAPVVSLYGSGVAPRPEHLADIDLVVCDLQDVGVRFYTYAWTMTHVIDACAAASVPVVVLDRPNPLGGDLAAAEGPILDETITESLVGRHSIPVRHSLTLGELARLWVRERCTSARLSVVTMTGWRRRMHWPQLGLPFVPASPAMPGYDTAIVYPGACFLEGTNLSEGRGTSFPFRVAGAPWLDAVQVADRLNAAALPGFRARPVEFQPSASKFADMSCRGVMLHVTDAARFRPVAAGLHLICAIRGAHPSQFAWGPYPRADDPRSGSHFDRLVGSKSVRRSIQDDPTAAAALVEQWTEAPGWARRVAPILLYPR